MLKEQFAIQPSPHEVVLLYNNLVSLVLGNKKDNFQEEKNRLMKKSCTLAKIVNIRLRHTRN